MSGFDLDQVDAQAEVLRISGRVKWFDAGKGYGFVVPALRLAGFNMSFSTEF